LDGRVKPGHDAIGDSDQRRSVRAPPTSNHRQTVILATGYFDYSGDEEQCALLLETVKRFFEAT
jgi:hypothetical protein